MWGSTGTTTTTCCMPRRTSPGRFCGRICTCCSGCPFFRFATGWMGQNHFALPPSALYGFVLLMAGIAYLILQKAIIASQGPTSVLRKAIGGDWKGKLSPLLYVAGIVISLFSSWAAQTIYAFVALLWLVPDR